MSDTRPIRLTVNSGGPQALPEWRAHFAEFAPEIEVVDWAAAAADPAGVRYALVWAPEPGRLAALPDLRLIVSAGAGVDHVLADPLLPAHLPIVRMITDESADGMAEYVLAAALTLLRDFGRVLRNQAGRRWEELPSPRLARETRVGVMGLGRLGSATARLLARAGFQVAGWSRSRAELPGVACHAGDDEFDAFLAGTDILVCLLPGTEATRGILGERTFSRLPRGASVINAGRGSHVAIPELIAALDGGQLACAVLDVFEREPLDPDSPLWTHPGVIVTPHCATTPSRRDRARRAAELIRRCERGEPLPDLYEPSRGY